MSEIAIRNNHHLDVPTGTEPATAQLVQWAQAATAAAQFAEAVCNSQAVPQQYRGKTQEAAAAILAGAEVGLTPMASLRAFDNIQGTPAPKAMTLRAIAQGLGHKVRIDESTPERAVVSGLRNGDTEWQTSTWTIQRAQMMGLTGKAQWKQQPAAMLVARATAEVCRWIASDAIMGMPYTAEEVRDQGVTVEARPAPRMISADDILGGQDSASVAAVESAPTAGDQMATDDQRDEMRGLWGDLGFGGDENRDNRLVITTKILRLSESLETLDDLTFDEAETVIAALKARLESQQNAAQGGES